MCKQTAFKVIAYEVFRRFGISAISRTTKYALKKFNDEDHEPSPQAKNQESLNTIELLGYTQNIYEE